ncbi:PREDICTED: liprin-beta [Ceratosolen solmsi marchali]|uniref:Liprin-beta n=1 Tax=Ceratosolen solmsi marchali TaxID=326594 RepID=A0AAJ6YMP7_9HYME|nr:PREDICTED: liprin-beta [Ceratosolen solmsi marchali]
MGKGEVISDRTDTNESTSYLTKSTSEASKMLEAALLQMDGILSGAENNSEWKDHIKNITRNLITVIQNAPTSPPPPDPTTTEILLQWLQPVHCINSQSESFDAASTIKHWNNRWTPSELYDSSGTTSTSEPSEDYTEDSPHINFDTLSFHNQTHGFCKSQGCLCQSCLLGYARVIALQGSLPNICTSGKVSHLVNSSFHNTTCTRSQILFVKAVSIFCSFSISTKLAQHVSKDMPYIGCGCSSDQHICNCHLSPYANDSNSKMFGSIKSTGSQVNGMMSSIAVQNNRCVGSLDRRRKKLKNKIDRDHRAKSQSDLIYCDKKINSHYCSPQQFQCMNNLHSNRNSNSIEERLRKLEYERSALRMEISILSEQVDVQSSKIIELENALQEKQDSLRNMEESLQKEVLSRSALETQKLELLTSLSEIKLRQASLERENLTLRNTNTLTNGERFSRHAGHYSSLPRPPTATKKGVVFADEEKTLITDTTNYIKSSLSKPFVNLSILEVGEWLLQLGLESYTNELKRWGATGHKLLNTSYNQLEKEIDIKNVLHKKKFLYAIESEKYNGAGFLGSDKMDNVSVLRWLDDIGLPQHKEAFHNAKVDGRVLHRLTTDDLVLLNVTAQLHAASLRRGIQCEVMDKNKTQVALWTNHRVMEWLRIVDLAEYAPNMRGSGVHGGLIVYEHRFTSELLATLLSIPPVKTLLRRHLTTHFNEIVGREVVQQKREIENTLGFVPLTLTARLKVPKRTQFTLKRKKCKNEIDVGNLVCPLEGSPTGTPSTSSTSLGSPNLNSPTF